MIFFYGITFYRKCQYIAPVCNSHGPNWYTRVMITQPTIIVLFGITGDLSKRKLLPAIAQLREQGELPEKFKLVGVTRREGVEIEGVETFKMDLGSPADYGTLKIRLEEIEKEFCVPAQRLFYMAVAPTVLLPIIEQLDAAGLSKVVNTKLLIEKPFGTDQENGAMLVHNINNYFVSEQVYRIDHYLAKDSVRELAKKHVEKAGLKKIEIIASESIAIEGRSDFYEQTGALRDFIQSHLLEVLATTLIDLPKETTPAPGLPPYGPEARLKVLQQLAVQDPIASFVKRGQYKGYREDTGNKDSMTETFVSVQLQSSDPLLKDVSIELKTGKALDKKLTEVRLFYTSATTIYSLDDKKNAYEGVFLDAIMGEKTFFISPEEVLEDWRIVAPIQEAWKQTSNDLVIYTQGENIETIV
jgi:glucose-6-phosphate 1-dehydrogenase